MNFHVMLIRIVDSTQFKTNIFLFLLHLLVLGLGGQYLLIMLANLLCYLLICAISWMPFPSLYLFSPCTGMLPPSYGYLLKGGENGFVVSGGDVRKDGDIGV